MPCFAKEVSNRCKTGFPPTGHKAVGSLIATGQRPKSYLPARITATTFCLFTDFL
jgi:hypothetical protein